MTQRYNELLELACEIDKNNNQSWQWRHLLMGKDKSPPITNFLIYLTTVATLGSILLVGKVPIAKKNPDVKMLQERQQCQLIQGDGALPCILMIAA